MKLRAPLLACVVVPLLAAPSAQAAVERQITVQGSCTREAVPDRGALTITADFTDPDLSAAYRKATQAYEQALASIRKLGLADFEAHTVESSVSEERDWNNGKSVFRGYHARMGLKVTTSDIGHLGQVIPIASREGIHDVSGLSTFLSPARLQKEKELCLKEAGENAHAKAQKLAGSVGATVGEVVFLTENPAPPRETVRPVMMRAMRHAPMAEEPAAPTIEPGSQDISVIVEAVFALH